MSDKSWGGRFDEDLDAAAADFSESVSFDQRLAAQDVRGSIAHARMLADRGVLTRADADKIEAGLKALGEEIADGRFTWDTSKEDVHMNVESALTARIGDAGARLHTGRSRNDQVATDMRIWTREACDGTAARLDQLVGVLTLRARQHLDLLMPGYTHLQRAQPIRLAHHLLAWCQMLERDRGRLMDARRRLNLSPLGSGALAATTFDIDREQTARELSFDGITENSLDAVGDRDFLIEVVSALVNCAVHLSRISEELVLWSTQEFGFMQMSDQFTTGSSMMPQKKNPDMAELVRGKCGRVVGDLTSLIVLMKGLPLAYNRDMQEDKPPVFDAFDTVDASLHILTGSLATARFFGDRMRAALAEGFVDATEVADYLVTKGVPFRNAHHVSGRLVAYALQHGKTLPDLTLEELRAEHRAFEEDIYHALDPETAIERRQVPGGPARAMVERALEHLEGGLIERGVDLKQVARKFDVPEVGEGA